MLETCGNILPPGLISQAWLRLGLELSGLRLLRMMASEISTSLLPQGVGGSDPQQKMDYPFLTPDDA